MASIYDTPADLNLIQTYVPLPFEEMARGLEARQGRYDETAAMIPKGAESLNVAAAGSADRNYMAALKEGYAREVVDEFQYGQVDLTDPNISARLNRKIHDYTNRPEFLTIASNAEVYPELKESVQRAMVEQPDSVWNYSDALGTVNAFDQYGTQAVGDLTNVAIAEPADVPGTLYDVLNNLQSSGIIKERDITALSTRFKSDGVLPSRIGLAFGIDLKTGEAKQGMPTWFKGNPVGQELTRMARHIVSNDEETTPENFNEKYQEELTSLYEDTVTNLLNAYAYNKVEDITGLGSLLTRGIEMDEGRPSLTYNPGVSARGLGAYNELKGSHATGFLDRFIMNKIQSSLGTDNRVDEIAGQIFDKNLRKGTYGQTQSLSTDDVKQRFDESKEEFVNAITTPIHAAILEPFTADHIEVGAQGERLARKGMHSLYRNTWGDMVESYAETLFETIALTSDIFDPARPFIQSEEADFNLIRVREKYESETGGSFDELSSTEKATVMNDQLFNHVAQLRRVSVEDVPRWEDPEKYQRRLASSVFRTYDKEDPMKYIAEADGDAPGILGMTTGFDEEGNEFNFTDKINEDTVIRLQGRLTANNPYGAGFFLVNVGGENVFIEGSQAEKNDQQLAWNLLGHTRSFNGISEDTFQHRIGDETYEIRSVEDPRANALRIDYRKPGDSNWKSYTGPENSIIDLFVRFESEFSNNE